MALAPNDPRHGSTNGYKNLGCRCAPCTTAWAAYLADYRRRKRTGGPVATTGPTCDPAKAHGHSGYVNYGCRCDVCSAAKREYDADYRRRKLSAGAV